MLPQTEEDKWIPLHFSFLFLVLFPAIKFSLKEGNPDKEICPHSPGLGPTPSDWTSYNTVISLPPLASLSLSVSKSLQAENQIMILFCLTILQRLSKSIKKELKLHKAL